MATDALEHDGPTQTSAAASLGALAGITPVVMFISWIAISGWGGTPSDFVKSLVAISAVAVAAGWIVGARSRRSVRSGLLGVVAYPAVAWLIFLPIGAIWSTVMSAADGTTSDAADVVASTVVASIASLLVYGLVSSLYVIPLLTPFGVGWALTYYALRRGAGV